MIERRLRLVVSHDVNHKRTKAFGKHLQKLKERFNCIFVSKNEKIYILKDKLGKYLGFRILHIDNGKITKRLDSFV